MKNWKRSVEWCRLNTICSSTAPELLSQLLLQSPALSSNPSIPLDPQITEVLKATLTKTCILCDWALNGSSGAQNQPQRLCLQPQLTSELQTKQGGLWEHSELAAQTVFIVQWFVLMVNNLLRYKHIWNSCCRVDLITDWPFLFNKLPHSEHSCTVTAHLPAEQPQKLQRGCHRQQVHIPCIINLLLQKARPLRTWLENTHPSPTVLALPPASQKAQLQNCWS